MQVNYLDITCVLIPHLPDGASTDHRLIVFVCTKD